MRKRIPQGSAHQLLCLALLPSPSQLLHAIGHMVTAGKVVSASTCPIGPHALILTKPLTLTRLSC